MAMKQKAKVASWFWITSAILTPFVMVAALFLLYFTWQIDSNRAQSKSIIRQINYNAETFSVEVAHMKDVSELVGLRVGDPYAKKTDAINLVRRPDPIPAEERNKPADKQSDLLKAYLDAEARVYGATASEPGMIHEYAAVRMWLNDWEVRLQKYIAVKTFQFYTLKTIDIDGATAVTVEGSLYRDIDETEAGRPVPPADKQDAAFGRIRVATTEDFRRLDRVMQPPTRVTMELVFRKQTQLIRDLVAANQHQYNLLYAETTGDASYVHPDDIGKDPANQRRLSIKIGSEGEDARKRKIAEEIDLLVKQIEDRRDVSNGKLESASSMADRAIGDTRKLRNDLDLMAVAGTARIERLATDYASEVTLHQDDASKFLQLIRDMPPLKEPIKLEKGEPDGEVSFSDYGRSICHINLGRSDGVRVGQRFEVWRPHGRPDAKDEFVAVVEIVRTLSAHYSLCTVLGLTDEKNHVQKGDKIISRIWHDGKFLKIALHGSFEPPNQAYSEARLTELLKLLGCTVVDNAQPGVDLVILGSRLLEDEWYYKARSDLRFDTLREEDVRLYVDPR